MGRVLVVEDDPNTLFAISTALRRIGYEVEEATTVLDGLQKLSNNPLWVILDLMLTDGNGTAIFERIRMGGYPIKVAVVTASDEENEHYLLAKKLRPEVFIHKPLNLYELISEINIR